MEGHTRAAAIRLCLALVVLSTSAGSEALAAASGAQRPSVPERAETMQRVRKNVKDLSPAERRQFVDAVLALKDVPSPYDPELNYYDQFVAWHLSLYPCGMTHHQATRAHGGPMFMPWHRLYLLLFENALREVSGQRITVPYWDWTDAASTSAVFSEDFMGGDGDPDDGFAVTTGPFAKGRWELNVHPIGSEWQASATTYLTRRFGSLAPMPDLPTADEVAFVLERPYYDVAPYDPASDPNLSFRNALEGFWRYYGNERVATGSQSMVCGPDGVMMATSGEGMHNRVHGWVGGLIGPSPEGVKFGTMFLPTSPNDPVFFLHHANIDRLWAEWQETHGIDSYEPDECRDYVDPGCAANTEADAMYPPFDATPADVADIDSLGYRYDTLDQTRRGRSRPLWAT